MKQMRTSELTGRKFHSTGASSADHNIILFIDPTCSWSMTAYANARKLVQKGSARLIVRVFSLKEDDAGVAAARRIEQMPDVVLWQYLDRLAERFNQGNKILALPLLDVSASRSTGEAFPLEDDTQRVARRLQTVVTPLVFVVNGSEAPVFVRRINNLASYIH